MKSLDELYMRRCLQLARCAAGSTSPNPMVGAVIVCDGRIIGEGFHVRAGEPHAEVNAVRSVKPADRHLLRHSTIYVTLEPCSHYGKTPPCCDMIIKEGIRRVVIGVTDNNECVNGAGIARMKKAGIEVAVGVLENECSAINNSFFTCNRLARPFITLKWAQTADGFIDVVREGGTPLHISTPVSQVAVHKLRAEHDAVLVGTRTAMLDNPSLNIRHWVGRAPLRLVIDRKGVLPALLKFGKNVEQVVLDFSSDVPTRILSHLHSLKIQSLLVEGGAQLLQSFIDASLWDCARVEINKSLIARGGVSAPVIPESALCAREMCGGNEILLFSR